MAKNNTKINSDAVEKQLVEEYLSGVASSVLMIKYGYKTKKSITDKVKKYKGQDFDFKSFRRQGKPYQLDFTKMDSPFIAYFLGLMLTDGYVSGERKFGIDLTDEDCISFISKITKQPYKTYPGRAEHHKDRHRIVFSDRENVEQLKRYSITTNKSRTVRGFDILPEEERFIPYFVRGLIDGDGTISKTSYGETYFSISSSSIRFLEWLQDILKNKMYMYELSNIYINKDGVGSFSSALKRNIEILKILSYDRPFGMMRKYNNIYE